MRAQIFYCNLKASTRAPACPNIYLLYGTAQNMSNLLLRVFGVRGAAGGTSGIAIAHAEKDARVVQKGKKRYF